MGEYYADYEALEFNNKQAIDKNIYPYYLNSENSISSLCPIFFAISNKRGTCLLTQNAFEENISFIKVLDKLISFQKKDKSKFISISFHNLKYDFRIIIYELFYNNFKQIFDSKTIEYLNYERLESDKTFEIVGENLSKFVSIKIKYNDYTFFIKDTFSIIAQSQNDILQAFGFETKIEVDWSKITIKNLKQNMKLIEQRCVYDTVSLAKSIELFKSVFYKKFKGKGSTASSMSLDAYKVYLAQLNNLDIYDREEKETAFRNIYPKLDKFYSNFSKACYSGGICSVNAKHASKIIKNVQMIDINSSYPYAMVHPLPVGVPQEIKGFEDDETYYYEYLVYVEFKFEAFAFQRCNSESFARDFLNIKKADKVYTRSDLPNEFNGYLCINSIDLKLLKQHATISNLKFYFGLKYQTSLIMKDFIEKLYDDRKKSKGVEKQAIKLLLNSLYGKFSQDLSNECFLYETVDKYSKVLAIDNNKIYQTVASAITAYARTNLVNTIYKINYNDFLYCDTDSIYFKNVEENKLKFQDVVDENELGKWAYEYEKIEKAKFLSKKNYLLSINNKLKLTCVGLSKRFHSKINFDNFILNSSSFMIEKMINIYGGKAMRQTTFEIKERFF